MEGADPHGISCRRHIHQRGNQIAFIHDGNHRTVAAAQLCQQGFRHVQMNPGFRAGRVAHVEDNVRFRCLFQGGAERLHQMMGQTAHQSHRVNEHDRFSPRQLQRPGGGVQCGEKPVFRQHAGLCQQVHQGAFSRVGIAHQRHGNDAILFPAAAHLFPPFFHLFQLFPQSGNPAADVAAVAFQLGFTGSAGAHAAAQTGQLYAFARQPGQHIFQLGQLYL